jgi:hypothetical protein
MVLHRPSEPAAVTGQVDFWHGNFPWHFYRPMTRVTDSCGESKDSEEISAEHLLNNRVQVRHSGSDGNGVRANKTNENWSVRTGQGELANRRSDTEF